MLLSKHLHRKLETANLTQIRNKQSLWPFGKKPHLNCETESICRKKTLTVKCGCLRRPHPHISIYSGGGST